MLCTSERAISNFSAYTSTDSKWYSQAMMRGRTGNSVRQKMVDLKRRHEAPTYMNYERPTSGTGRLTQRKALSGAVALSPLDYMGRENKAGRARQICQCHTHVVVPATVGT